MKTKKTFSQSSFPKTLDGQRRAVIERVAPEIDAGRYAIKRVPGETVTVEADIFADGHEVLQAVLKHRHESSAHWVETPMTPLVNDRWRAAFLVADLGQYVYTVEAWVDPFQTWRTDLRKRLAAGQDVTVDLRIGAALVREAVSRAAAGDADRLTSWAHEFGEGGSETLDVRSNRALDEEMNAVMLRHPDRKHASRYERELRVVVDPILARFSAWYEMFPRSCPGKAGAHGTFRDCEAHISHIARMGFDVLYLPPIHPIGQAFRKGRNNRPTCEPGEPGSPWGIGGAAGGHKSLHPELGTLEDFRALVRTAGEHGIKIAMDLAYQCSPDHPYVKAHPEWFKQRPDGTIQYAENPPKKYQDIYPINFETEDWRALWKELKSVVDYWIEQGVEIFRVDNPHTKALAFWEWMIADVKRRHPQVIFLSEAFTRPKLMYSLAKLGFTQSYNYFPWRNTKTELTEYLTELTRTEVREYFRPNLWPNTPDILTHYLQYGGRPAFMIRLVLAATLGASYGIYGPAFELCENTPREPGSEEYLNSEKYEIRDWKLDRPGNLTDFVSQVNRIRRGHPALHTNERLEFHAVGNPEIIAYSKTTPDGADRILVIVNLDRHYVQSGWVDLALHHLGLEPHSHYTVHDLLTDARYSWQGSRNYVQLNPGVLPAHVFHVEV